MQQWAGFSLAWRATLFHRRFPERRIKAATLGRLYRSLGIRYKKVRVSKIPRNTNVLSYMLKTSQCKRELEAAIKRGLPIVYCDETMFTKRTYASHDFGPKYVVNEVCEEAVYIGYVSAIAAVSADRGVDLVKTYNSSVNSEIFADFLDKLSKKRERQELALFMDNASFHKSNVVKEAMRRNNITPIMNVPYAPQYNPIEGCFSIVKSSFKRRRLNAMRNNKQIVI